MNDYSEKRNFKRMSMDCQFSFSEQGKEKSFDGKVINLSSQGILFTSEENFEAGALLDIVLTPANTITPPMEASVVVARVTDDKLNYQLACEITEIRSDA